MTKTKKISLVVIMASLIFLTVLCGVLTRPKVHADEPTNEVVIDISQYGTLYKSEDTFVGVDSLQLGDDLQNLDIYFVLPTDNVQMVGNYVTIETSSTYLTGVYVIGYTDNQYILRFSSSVNGVIYNLILSSGGNYHYHFDLSESVIVTSMSGSIVVYKSNFFEQFNNIVFSTFNGLFAVIGGGFDYLANNLFLTNGSLSQFTIILAVFFGISLSLAICKYVLRFITTFGIKKKKYREIF